MGRFNMEKGDKFSLEKGIKRILVGLGWDVKAQGPGEEFDLDASAFGLVNQNGAAKFYGDGMTHTVFYGNSSIAKKGAGGQFWETADGSIKHHGDNRTGAGDGDDEMISIILDKLPPEINEIAVFVTIYHAVSRKQDFSRIESSFVRIVDEDTGTELCRYNLKNEFAGMYAVQVGSLVKEPTGWIFKAVGAGANVELGQIIEQYE